MLKKTIFGFHIWGEIRRERRPLCGCYLHGEETGLAGARASSEALGVAGGRPGAWPGPGRGVKPVAWQAAVLGLGRGLGE
jgi:hypothetical protein